MNLRAGQTKAILRDIYNEFKIKDNTSDLRKLYVASPQREWIKNELKDEIMDYVDHSILAEHGIVNKKKLKNDYLAYCGSEVLGNSFFIWKFFNLEIWFRKFIKNSTI